MFKTKCTMYVYTLSIDLCFYRDEINYLIQNTREVDGDKTSYVSLFNEVSDNWAYKDDFTRS